MSRQLIHNAIIVTGCSDCGQPVRGWLLTDGELIHSIGWGDAPAELLDTADTVTDARGAMLMPGAIDTHVHFREPGLTHKATIASESRAAVAGGVTSFVDMPNTVPPTLSQQAVEAKAAIAAECSPANYAFWIGASADNIDELRNYDRRTVPGIKLFMGTSTGSMAVTDPNALARIFAETGAIIAIHAEDDHMIADNVARLRATPGFDPEALPMSMHSTIRSAEACVRATDAAMQLAQRYGTRLHVCHVTTALECSLLDAGDPADKLITAEVSPHHLLWCTDDYERQGARIKMNPAVKTAADRQALRLALQQGRIDTVATDHAPHLLSDKQGGPLKAASGAPMVQFSLAAMLELYPAATVANRMAQQPARLLGIERRGCLRPGYYADMVLVESHEPRIVTDEHVVSLCGWTPMAGSTLTHTPVATWVGGKIVYQNGSFTDITPGSQLTFAC